jgi:RNA polymerase sigma factor (sigma-70 family)
MDEPEWLAERFEASRTHLQAVAYRMLGSLSEADDAVQESWLRLSRSHPRRIANLGGWLTTVVARICLDMLRSRTARREQSLEAAVSESIPSRAEGSDPEQAALLADSVGLALLVVLDTLPPAERLAFVLHDIFAAPFDEIAPIVERSEAAARQLASGQVGEACLRHGRLAVQTFLLRLLVEQTKGIVTVARRVWIALGRYTSCGTSKPRSYWQNRWNLPGLSFLERPVEP